jgi:hypothetical protein
LRAVAAAAAADFPPPRLLLDADDFFAVDPSSCNDARAIIRTTAYVTVFIVSFQVLELVYCGLSTRCMVWLTVNEFLSLMVGIVASPESIDRC